MTEIPEYQIAKLSPRPGDVIVVKVDRVLTRQQLADIGDCVMPYFEEVGCKIVVLGRDVDLQVVEQIPARRPAHIYIRSDGQEAACGFPVFCPECEADRARKPAAGKS